MTSAPVTEPSIDQFNSVVLERLKLAARATMPRYLASHLTAEEIAGEISDHFTYQLRTEILAERLKPQRATGHLTVKFEAPATWWQHFKHRYRFTWWLRWYVKRREVRMRTATRTGTARFDIERYRAFPEASIEFPKWMGGAQGILVAGAMKWRVDGKEDNGEQTHPG